MKGDGGPADGIGDVVSQASQGCRGDCWGGHEWWRLNWVDEKKLSFI